MDRLAAMENFVAVIDAGSITAAAKRLGVGQPTISKSLAALEAYLGVQLLVRSTRGSSLTEAGRRFLAQARTTLDEADAAEAAARDEAANLRGPLRVAAPPAYASEVIVPRFTEFSERHPDLTLDLVLDDRRVDLVGEGIDLALRGGSLQDSAIIARRIDTPARIVVAGANYLIGRDTPTHPRDLLTLDWIDYAPWTGRNWVFSKGQTQERVTFAPRLTISAADGLRSAILHGLGCAIVSERMVQRELGSPELVRLLPDWQLESGELWLCSPAGRRMNARARAFADWLGQLIRELPKT
ncbi:LysR family transcriptional regulator [Erythrobacter ani]|uniref:LysR family transcriptional regulator n=1 Tax=Erythrobacter ani TaxID=2827235 RepID=A0ABS6SM90_9SPHN|nr:LysR family transcriptional regulator [Erythrobacter ani]MBV7266155.1 LysR family transcriptional regulator [Erythrobacter ani]